MWSSRERLVSSILLLPVVSFQIGIPLIPCHPVFRSEHNISRYTVIECQWKSLFRKKVLSFIMLMIAKLPNEISPSCRMKSRQVAEYVLGKSRHKTTKESEFVASITQTLLALSCRLCAWQDYRSERSLVHKSSPPRRKMLLFGETLINRQIKIASSLRLCSKNAVLFSLYAKKVWVDNVSYRKK